MLAAFAADGAVIAGGRVAPTVSVGVAAVSPAAYSLQEMVSFADSLYQAKANGRNCVRLSESVDGGAAQATMVVEAPPLKPVLVSSILPTRSRAS